MSPLEHKGPRVLVVDDEPMVLDLVTTRLVLAGYEVAIARNGLEALEQLKTARPAAMLLDINMPVLDGFGVLQHMKDTGEIRRVPTMALTARNFREDAHRAVALGARDYLSKPFKDSQLLARVARLTRAPAAPSAGPFASQPAGSGNSIVEL